MSEPKFTPAPWVVRAEHLRGGKYWCVYAHDAHNGDYHSLDVELHEDENGEANARLIAAAPDLYEALSDLLATLDFWRKAYPSVFGEHEGAVVSPQRADTYQRARDALAKVESGQ